jgi:Tol biopolymer transport system component
VRGSSSRSFVAGELWVSDLATGRRERLLPGFEITRYDVSADGNRIIFAASDSAGKSFLWLASLDRRFPPRQMTTAEAFRPFFAPDGEIFYLEKDGDSDYVYRMKEDGSGKQRIVPDPLIYLISSSPDRKWVVVWKATNDPINTQEVVAYPTAGGEPRLICKGCSATGPANLGAPTVSWSPDQKYFYLNSSIGMMSGYKSYRIPLARGAALPPLPSSGFRSQRDLLSLPRASVAEQSDIFPGPNPGVYAFNQTTTHRNLYRVQLPR